MKEEHIKNLIEKYKSGRSSLEDEKHLFDKVETEVSIKKLAFFVKKTKREIPKNFNEKLWESFEKRTIKKNKFRIGIISSAATILVIITLYISNFGYNKQSYSEKETLLNQAQKMFVAPIQKQLIHAIIIESDLIVVYTKIEKINN